MSTLDEFKSRKIRVFRNGDIFTPGKKLVISPRVYRNYEQFLHNISLDLNLLNGAVRRVYTMEGHLIESLDDLIDGAFYVATAGEMFKRVRYSLKEEHETSMASIEDGVERRKMGFKKRFEGFDGLREEPRMGEKPIFGPSSKAYRIVVFLNGEPGITPLKLVLNYRNCKSFDQVIMSVSSAYKKKITKLFDTKGRRVTSLHDLRDGQNLVAVGIENFKPASYPAINPANSQFDIKKEDDTPHILTFYPNGDAYHHGYTLTVKKSRFKDLKKLLETLNQVIELVPGRAQRIYALDGHKIETLDELLTYTPTSNPNQQQQQQPKQSDHTSSKPPLPTDQTYAEFSGLDEPIADSNVPAGLAGAAPAAQSHQQQQQQGHPHTTVNHPHPHHQHYHPHPVQNTYPTTVTSYRPRSFVLVSGDEPFFHIRYDVNGVRHKPVFGLQGSTQYNELMELIRKPRIPKELLTLPEGVGGSTGAGAKKKGKGAAGGKKVHAASRKVSVRKSVVKSVVVVSRGGGVGTVDEAGNMTLVLSDGEDVPKTRAVSVKATKSRARTAPNDGAPEEIIDETSAIQNDDLNYGDDGELHQFNPKSPNPKTPNLKSKNHSHAGSKSKIDGERVVSENNVHFEDEVGNDDQDPTADVSPRSGAKSKPMTAAGMKSKPMTAAGELGFSKPGTAAAMTTDGVSKPATSGTMGVAAGLDDEGGDLSLTRPVTVGGAESEAPVAGGMSRAITAPGTQAASRAVTAKSKMQSKAVSRAATAKSKSGGGDGGEEEEVGEGLPPLPTQEADA
ncbi:Doublecortin domain-containing protein 2C [Blyttiomyces sp. JEL0837]|nr:Doublecortin domain-containing protein 2C [Blyttiomyces sp. JEL0837]